MTYPEFVAREAFRARLRAVFFALCIGVLVAVALWSRAVHALVLGQAAAPDFVHSVVLPQLAQAAFNPTVWAALAAVAYAILSHLKWSKAQLVKDAIGKAFHIVEDMKATGELPEGAVKPIIALEQLQALLSQNNVEVTPAIAAAAKLTWSAMHGEQKVGGTP